MKDLSLRSVPKPNIGVVTIPTSVGGLTPLSNLVDLIGSFSGKVRLITGDVGYAFFKNNQEVEVYGVGNRGTNVVTKVARSILAQLRMAYNVVRLTRDTDFWIFFFGGPISPLVILIARLLKKKVVLIYGGSDIESIKAQSKILSKPVELLARASPIFSNKIVLYSENLIKECKLEKYRHKIAIAPRHFLDFDKFKMRKPPDERQNLVGYIGRLSQEKGIMNFIEAIPEILKERGETKFLVGGVGQLRDRIDKYLAKENLTDKVTVLGWIPHDELPNYLNELKLLVLPSYTEGLPNIMLEAMACGTPILATPVGAIPDMIKDSETGFTMKDNSPECIAKNVIRILKYPDLEKIARNTCVLVEREFTYEKAVERYRQILGNSLK